MMEFRSEGPLCIRKAVKPQLGIPAELLAKPEPFRISSPTRAAPWGSCRRESSGRFGAQLSTKSILRMRKHRSKTLRGQDSSPRRPGLVHAAGQGGTEHSGVFCVSTGVREASATGLTLSS